MHHQFNRHARHGTTLLGLVALLSLTFGTTRADVVEGEETVMTGSVGEFLEAVWSSNAEDRLAVAKDCYDLVEDLSQVSREPEEVVRNLVARLKVEPVPWIRFSCLLSLAERRSDRPLSALFIHFLAEGRTEDLWPALYGLAEKQNPEAVPHLKALWPALDRPWLRPLLVQALANNGSDEYLEEFTRLAQTDLPEEENLAWAAINALGILGDETSVPVLLRLTQLDRPEDEYLARAAIGALGDLGDEAAIPVLVHLSGIDGPMASPAARLASSACARANASGFNVSTLCSVGPDRSICSIRSR